MFYCHLHIKERLIASRLNEMVKLRAQKHGYKYIFVKSAERIDKDKALLLTRIDPQDDFLL
jgi:hypothetical protein